jgi:hypothetical protein
MSLFKTVGSKETEEYSTTHGEVVDIIFAGDDKTLAHIKCQDVSILKKVANIITLGFLFKQDEFILPKEESKYFNTSLFYPGLEKYNWYQEQGIDVDLSYLGDSYGNPYSDEYKMSIALDMAIKEKSSWKYVAFKMSKNLISSTKDLRQQDWETVQYATRLMKLFQPERRMLEKDKIKGKHRLEALGVPPWAEETSSTSLDDYSEVSGKGMLARATGRFGGMFSRSSEETQ